MSSFNEFWRPVHRSLSRWPRGVRVALYVRNHADRIIGYSLGVSADPDLNGEHTVIKVVAPRCRTFVDVGANVGNWSSRFLDHCPQTCSGLLFEPGEQAFIQLEQRFRETEPVELVQAAAGSQIGRMDFYEEPEGGTESSLLKATTSASAVKRSVAVTTIDEEVLRRGWETVDYLKVDAEGYDYYVLQGAEHVLSRQKVRLIQFEYNRPWAEANATLAGALGLLDRNGYTCYVIRSNGLYEHDYERYGEYFFYSNFLAVSPQSGDWIESLVVGKD